MNIIPTLIVLPFLSASIFFFSFSFFSVNSSQDFQQCLTHQNPFISQLIYTPDDPNFHSILYAYIMNQRHTFPTPTPSFIVTPTHLSHIQSTIHCAKSSGLQLRIRSGGHDFEGLSYISQVPYVILDLFNLRSISVDVESRTAWVGAGATLGDVYYSAWNASPIFGFPAGYWSTVGVGGHLSGGGYGPLIRKYGIASDNILDAVIIMANGTVLDRDSMSEDLFWAIRGGGGGNFGVVYKWKIRLVEIPESVTLCLITRTIDQNLTDLLYKWQYVAPKMPEDLLVEVQLGSVNGTTKDGSNRVVQAIFQIIQLGPFRELKPVMDEMFPDLGMVRGDCNETRWIDVVLRLGNFPIGTPPELLLNRTAPRRRWTKQKSDYVEKPIPKRALDEIWGIFQEIDAGAPQMTWTPYGGRMSEISESDIPYPHRKRNLFMIFESVNWNGTVLGATSPRHIDWIERLHDYMTKYVAKCPRSSYANYRDLDLGVNNIDGNTSYEQASVWGDKYFRDNFKRLAIVKTIVDPENFFRNEQSIPILSS